MKKQDENIQNLFGNAGNKQPFRVPENYFETFADRIKYLGERERRRYSVEDQKFRVLETI